MSSLKFILHLASGSPSALGLTALYPGSLCPVILSGAKNLPDVQLIVYDILGNEIAVLVNEEKSAGRYEVNFNADGLASGVHIYRLIAGDFIETKKMVLLRQPL